MNGYRPQGYRNRLIVRRLPVLKFRMKSGGPKCEKLRRPADALFTDRSRPRACLAALSFGLAADRDGCGDLHGAPLLLQSPEPRMNAAIGDDARRQLPFCARTAVPE